MRLPRRKVDAMTATIEEQIAWLKAMYIGTIESNDYFGKHRDTELLTSILQTLIAAQTTLIPTIPDGYGLDRLSHWADVNFEPFWIAKLFIRNVTPKPQYIEATGPTPRTAVLAAIAKTNPQESP